PYALRHRHEQRPHAGRGRPAVLGDARTHPPDRGQGAKEAEASEPVKDNQKLPRLIEGEAPIVCDWFGQRGCGCDGLHLVDELRWEMWAAANRTIRCTPRPARKAPPRGASSTPVPPASYGTRRTSCAR